MVLVRSTLLLAGLGVLATHAFAARAVSQTGTPWRDPSPHQVRFMTVDSSVQLEVLDWGGSGRPIVLLGCYLTAHVYDEFAPKLTDQFHVIGITRRGIGASDKPAVGYTVQRSADDVLEVLESLTLQKPVLVGNSCAGQVLTLLASQHGDRVGGLVYLDAAEDPTLTLADYNVPLEAFETSDDARAHLPASIKAPPAPDYSSFEAYRLAQRRELGFAFPEAELRQLFVANADGSMGPSLLSPVVRKAIVEDNKIKPDYARIRVPVLAVFRTAPPFDEWAREFLPRDEQERAALRQRYAFGRAMVSRWERDLLAGVPTARIVELPGANLYMFLSNEADVLREARAFVASPTAPPKPQSR
jgi:non-heme chloroperoxidase